MLFEKEDATINCHSSKVINEQFVQWVQHFVNEIEHGKYKNKKKFAEMIIEDCAASWIDKLHE